jgi:hypothetical protein
MNIRGYNNRRVVTLVVLTMQQSSCSHKYGNCTFETFPLRMAGTAQSVELLAAGFTVREYSPVVGEFSVTIQTGPGANLRHVKWV